MIMQSGLLVTGKKSALVWIVNKIRVAKMTFIYIDIII